MNNHPKMKPRHGSGPLHVLVIGRVSTPHQDVGNIEAGYLYVEKILKDITDCETEIRRLGEQCSGMIVERDTILEAYELIEAGWPDVILMEDVSKSYRNPRWIYAFVQDCYDHDVRVIAPGDALDTWDENWEVVLATAALRHGLHIPDTRRRVRRTSAKSFAEGGMVLRVRFGYRKLSKQEAASGQYGPKGLRLTKVPEHTPVFDALWEMVVHGRKGGEALAQWLNDHRIPLPPYIRKSKRWTAKLILDLLRDPLLYGLRQFPKMQYKSIMGSGKHRRSKNPDPPRQPYPELAHMTEAQWREMNAVLDELGQRNHRPAGHDHPRHGVGRKDSFTPLQHCTCAACESFYYLSGNGVIKCSGALEHGPEQCWNHVQVSVQRCREAMVDLVLARLAATPGATEVLLDAAWEQIEHRAGRRTQELKAVEKEIREYQVQAERLADAIVAGGQIKTLVERAKRIEKQIKVAQKHKREIEQADDSGLPRDRRQLAIQPRAALLELAGSSFEFAELMRKLIPGFVIQPVQALDCGQVRPRAILTLDLGALLPKGADPALRPSPVQVTVDLFDPPEHIKHLQAVVRLKEEKLTRGEKASLEILAKELGIGRMTVKRALGYHKKMLAEGSAEPYRFLTAAPAAASRWKGRRPGDASATAA